MPEQRKCTAQCYRKSITTGLTPEWMHDRCAGRGLPMDASRGRREAACRVPKERAVRDSDGRAVTSFIGDSLLTKGTSLQQLRASSAAGAAAATKSACEKKNHRFGGGWWWGVTRWRFPGVIPWILHKEGPGCEGRPSRNEGRPPHGAYEAAGGPKAAALARA